MPLQVCLEGLGPTCGFPTSTCSAKTHLLGAHVSFHPAGVKCHTEDPGFPVGQSLALGEHVECSLGKEGRKQGSATGSRKLHTSDSLSHPCHMARKK